MPRLIDADALIATLEKIADEDGTPYFHLDEITQEIFDAPTIDPESLRPCGEWGTISINKENRTVFIECAECGATFTIPLFDFGLCYHYCPNCGAKKDEDEK